MERKIITLNNFKENSTDIKFEDEIHQMIDGKENIISFDHTKMDKDEIMEMLDKEYVNLNTVYSVERASFTHLNNTYIFEILGFINPNDRDTANITVSGYRVNNLNNTKETLIDKIVGQFIIFVNGLKEFIPNNKMNWYSLFFNREINFYDYSEKPIKYNGDGYISINNGDKYPLFIVEWDNEGRNRIGTIDIDKNNLTFPRSKFILEEIYSAKALNMIIRVTSVAYDSNAKLIEINYFADENNPETLFAYMIELGKERVEMKDVTHNNSIKRISDKEINIIIDCEWLPDLIELQDGFGTKYKIDRYQQFKIVK